LFYIEAFADRLALAIDKDLLFPPTERAINMRDDVLAIVSHDLRSPLGTIMIHAESLAEVPDVRNIGTAIARSAQRMNRLIGDLLDASALNAGKLTLECRQHSVAAIVDEAVEMFRSQAVARGISLTDSCPPDAQVYCDRDRVVQVLSNLIGNAIKFTARGSVSVIAAKEDKSVRIAVADTGSGIAPDQLPRLFDRFWRAQAHRHGAGLGLFIARGIIAAHGSKLEVETTYGVGTKFHFCLAETKS
jgi:signal transduction histidine kinase